MSKIKTVLSKALEFLKGVASKVTGLISKYPGVALVVMLACVLLALCGAGCAQSGGNNVPSGCPSTWGYYEVTEGTLNAHDSDGQSEEQDLTGALMTVSQNECVLSALGCFALLEEETDGWVLQCDGVQGAYFDSWFGPYTGNTLAYMVFNNDEVQVDMQIDYNFLGMEYQISQTYSFKAKRSTDIPMPSGG